MVKWDTSGEWDSATSETGIVHDSIANTDYGDASTVHHAIPIGNRADNITNSLEAHFPLQENSSGTAYDFSGNNNDGNVNGPNQGVTGLLNTSAYSFNGSGDTVNLGNTLSQVTSHTWSVWFKTSSGSGTNLICTHGRNKMRIKDQKLSGNIYDGGNQRTYSSINVDDGNWHHGVTTHDGSTYRLYLDGTQVDSTSAGNINYAGRQDGLGGSIEYSQKYYTGKLADARFYTQTLSGSQISTIYDWVTGTGRLTTAEKIL